MKRLFAKLKSWIDRLRRLVVTAYADRIYRRAVKVADECHENMGEMIYVVSSLRTPDALEVYNRKRFRNMKRFCGLDGVWMPISDMKSGCWYHTANRAQEDGLTPAEKEARRLVFLKMVLKRAGLEK